MLNRNTSDSRFVTIKGTGTTIESVWQQLPTRNNTWKICVSYKENELDVLNKSMDIIINSSRFKEEIKSLAELKDSTEEKRLCFAHGMTDIDMYINNKRFIIRWSPNDGLYVYIELPIKALKELNKLLNQ